MVNHHHYLPEDSSACKFVMIANCLVSAKTKWRFFLRWRAKLPGNKQVEGNMWIRMFLHEHLWIQLLRPSCLTPLCSSQAQTNKAKQGSIRWVQAPQSFMKLVKMNFQVMPFLWSISLGIEVFFLTFLHLFFLNKCLRPQRNVYLRSFSPQQEP